MKTYGTKLLLLFFFCILAVFSSFSQKIHGNHNVTIKERSILSFNEVEINGGYEILLSKGDKESLKIEADDNLHQYIEVDVKGNTLFIRNKKDIEIHDSKKMKIYLTYNNLNKLEVNGAADIETTSPISGTSFKLEISGAAKIVSSIQVDQFFAELNGAATITLKGKVRNAGVELFNGVGNLSAYDLKADNFKISISGAGKADINVSKKLDVSISGVGCVNYKGNPQMIHDDVSFLGSLHHVDND
jgi:hypothetical protein